MKANQFKNVEDDFPVRQPCLEFLVTSSGPVTPPSFLGELHRSPASAQIIMPIVAKVKIIITCGLEYCPEALVVAMAGFKGKFTGN